MRSQPHDAQAVPAHGSLVISYATKTDHQFDAQFHRSHALAKTGDNLVRPLPRRARLARVAKSFRKQWGLGLASNEFNWTLDTGFGLPWKSLFEMALPYNLVQQQVTDIAAGPPQQASNRWGNSLGDPTVALAKTFVHESGWISRFARPAHLRNPHRT
jgi:hypothetical protein